MSCWFRALLLMDPVVFEFASIESLLFFVIARPSTLQPCSPTAIILGGSVERSVWTSNLPSSVPMHNDAPSTEKRRDVTLTL